MHKIVGEILSISYEGRQPVAVIELRDGSEAMVIMDNKFHPVFKGGEDALFEGSWSADISNSGIKLFFAEYAFDNFMKLYELKYWKEYLGQFSFDELWDFCQDSGENERNHRFCLNFHLVAFERFSYFAAAFGENEDEEFEGVSKKAAEVESNMVRAIARDLDIDLSNINSFIELVNKETELGISS